MRIPSFVTKWRSEAKKLLLEGGVKDIEFSSATYQVEVEDPHDQCRYWAFMQFAEGERVKDFFCSCEADSGCLHLAAAFFAITKGNEPPLHIRYAESFWNLYFCALFEETGDTLEVTEKKEEGVYFCKSAPGLSLCSKTLDGKEMVKKLLHMGRTQTEETSLKFSGLSEEEIEQWRAGRPSPSLRFELSFWSDLAKWLMLLQEGGRLRAVSFMEDERGLPTAVQADFDDITLHLPMDETLLARLIPSFSGLKTHLYVEGQTTLSFKSATFDKEAGFFLVEAEEALRPSDEELKKAIHVGNYLFLYGKGFFLKEKEKKVWKREYQGREVSGLLRKYTALLEPHFSKKMFHFSPVSLSYFLFFDRKWNLHMSAYLFEQGDLQAQNSHFFGDFAYLEGKGFYPLEHVLFPEDEMVIPSNELSTFVFQNRAFLQKQEGFVCHLTHIESTLSYKVDGDGTLSFTSKVEIPKTEGKTHDFGPFIYVDKVGFFAKGKGDNLFPFPIDAKVPRAQVSLFLRMYEKELSYVEGFFTKEHPVKRAGLNIEMEGKNICVTPQYEIGSEYDKKDLFFFDEFVYLSGKGFAPLPILSKVPQAFREVRIVPPAQQDHFFISELPHLLPFAFYVDPHLDASSQLKLKVVEESGGDLKLRYDTEKGSVDVSDLMEASAKGKKFFCSPAGRIDLRQDRFYWLRKQKVVKGEGGLLSFTALERMRLSVFENIPFSPRLERPVEHGALVSQLRPYQLVGLSWLWSLYEHKLSALLCDDMGLGKTHQAMGLLASVKHYAKEGKRPCFLVVCPTSVLYHWQDKLQQYLPSFTVLTYHGRLRSLSTDCDVLLTSYGTLRSEIEELKQIPFEVAIFDELQIAKNESSIVHGCLAAIKAEFRLGLTGTPIENRLRELKSLFDLIVPTYFPQEAEYREFFLTPIEKRGDEKRKELLSKLIRPFILRRKKETVLTELPPKVEEVAHCGLSAMQRELYIATLAQERENVLSTLRKEESPIPYVHVFAILSHLKQICDHPAVFLKRPEEYKQYESGKWDLFVELLSEARESGQKVVVFSQYLHMLDIFELYLQENGVGYASIRGATQRRGEEIKRFNGDPDCEVFVASLQAAGLGVDLTAASVVIHYDRWWNKARESQATDRVHRIGQMRGVEVFKLVTKGTFEERIDKIIEQKGKLMEEVIGADDHRFIKRFDREELLQLLSTPTL